MECEKEVFIKKEIKAAFLNFYSGLYKRKTLEIERLEDYIQKHVKRVTKEDNEILEKLITQEEILKAIESIKTGKAPGPDGYTAKFYRVFKKEVAQWF